MEKLGFSIAEVAKLLGVSRPTVYALINNEQLPTIHAGRRVIVPAEQFKHWIESRSTGRNDK